MPNDLDGFDGPLVVCRESKACWEYLQKIPSRHFLLVAHEGKILDLSKDGEVEGRST